MLPNASDLQFFLEVARAENLSRAAERIGITQPALSQAMKRLESAFERQLLLRGKGGVKLTKAGEKLAFKSRQLLDQWETIKEEAQKDDEVIRGRYTLGVHPSVALYTSHLFLPQLLAKYPGLEFKLVHDLSRRITEEVVSFKVDFGLVINPFPHPDLVIKEVYKDEVIFCRSKKLTPSNDLESEDPVLILEPDLIQSQDLVAKAAKKKLRFRRTVTSSNLEVIRHLVLSGAGIGILPCRVLGDDLKRVENLSDPNGDWGLPRYQDKLSLVFRADVQKGSASRALAKSIFDSLTEV